MAVGVSDCGTASLAGLAVGVPLLHDRLLEFPAQLPSDFKLKRLMLRWCFKESLRGILADEIIAKKKHGSGLPFGIWATQHAALRRLAEDSLSSLAGRCLVRQEFMRTLVSERLALAPGYYGEMLWILVMLENWLRVRVPHWRLES